MHPAIILLIAACQPITIAAPLFTADVQPGYSVPTTDGLVSLYAENGYLAHNTHEPGASFDRLEPGDLIRIGCKDGRVIYYRITTIRKYQALDLYHYRETTTGETLTDVQLFKLAYNHPGEITLQTCIRRGDLDTWGRLFITAQERAPRRLAGRIK